MSAIVKSKPKMFLIEDWDLCNQLEKLSSKRKNTVTLGATPNDHTLTPHACATFLQHTPVGVETPVVISNAKLGQSKPVLIKRIDPFSFTTNLDISEEFKAWA